MKLVLVTGGRDYDQRNVVYSELDRQKGRLVDFAIITGGCTGADMLAMDWSAATGVHCAVVHALWDKYKSSAGPRRNRAMLMFKPTIVLAFPGGKGTKSMVEMAKAAGVNVLEVQ